MEFVVRMRKKKYYVADIGELCRFLDIIFYKESYLLLSGNGEAVPEFTSRIRRKVVSLLEYESIIQKTMFLQPFLSDCLERVRHPGYYPIQHAFQDKWPATML